MADKDISVGVALGGTGALTEDVVKSVFHLEKTATITNKKYE